MIVKVKGAGVKLAGKWCFKNETVEISKEEYKNNKEYVEVIQEDIEESKNPEGELNNGSDTNDGAINEGENSGEDNKDEELETLKEEAKKLGINVTHNMRKDTIIKKIEEINVKKEESKNPEGE